MARLASFSLTVVMIACLLVALQGTAWGYVDPGSGFVALQSFASVAAASAYFLRRRLRSLFTGKDAGVTPSEPAAHLDPAVRLEKDTRRPA